MPNLYICIFYPRVALSNCMHIVRTLIVQLLISLDFRLLWGDIRLEGNVCYVTNVAPASAQSDLRATLSVFCKIGSVDIVAHR